MPSLVLALIQSATRPHSISEWRVHGLDYLLDVGLDVAGVILGAFVAWLAIRVIAQRIEKLADDGKPDMHSAREQRARTAAKLFRNMARAILLVITVLLVVSQLGFNITNRVKLGMTRRGGVTLCGS